VQSEVLYGARLSAVFRGVVPLFFAIVFITSNGGDLDGVKVWIALGALVVGLWQIRGAFKPKQLVLDRYGLVYQPTFPSGATSLDWAHVKGFEIKGKDKNRNLVCHYLDPDNGSAQTLNLGDGWNAGGNDLFADRLDKVCDYLEDARRGYQPTAQSATASAQRPLVEIAKRPVSQVKPQQASAPVRSGQVYARQSAAVKAPPVTLSRPVSTAASRIAGWGLLAIGSGVGAVSAFAFAGACKRGLCGHGMWDVPDARLWIFFAIWSACLWAIWAGMKKIQG